MQMFERLRKAGAKVTKLENLGLQAMKLTPTTEKDNSLCGVIRREALLPDELNTTDFTKEQRKKRTDVSCLFCGIQLQALKAQQEMDEQVLKAQLDPARMEESFDPVPEVIVLCRPCAADACREITPTIQI